MRICRGIWLSPIVGLLASGCVITGTSQVPGQFGTVPVGLHMSGGTGGFGVTAGTQTFIGPGVIQRATVTRSVFASPGGGMLPVDPLRAQQAAQVEATRQAQIDKELNRQIEAQQQKASPGGLGAGSGLILVEDHLAPGGRAAPPPPPGNPPPRGKGLILVTDHLPPPALQGSSAAAENPRGPSRAATHARGRQQEIRRDPETRRLEGEIAAARERRRKLLARLQGAPAARAPARSTATPAPSSLPGTDPDGFRPVYERGRLVRKERDVNGDGRPDVLRYYDETGRLLREEEDSHLDGRLDTRTFYTAGRPLRKESDTNGDGRVDLWAFFDAAGNLARTEADTNHDGHRDRVIRYARGVMVEEQRYRPGLDHPQVRIAYAKGEPTRKEEDTDQDGRIDRVTEYDGSGHVTKVSRDPSDRGGFTFFTYYQPETGAVLREEEDTDGNGRIDVISHYEGGRLARREFFDLPKVTVLTPAVSRPPLPSAKEIP